MDNLEETYFEDEEEEEYTYYCVFCKANLGHQNPRQLCGKTYCPYEEEYFELYDKKFNEYKKELSQKYIEKNWGMFSDKGCVEVDKVIQKCNTFSSATLELDKLKFGKFTSEVNDKFVKNLVFTFYQEIEELVNSYLDNVNLSRGLY